MKGGGGLLEIIALFSVVGRDNNNNNVTKKFFSRDDISLPPLKPIVDNDRSSSTNNKTGEISKVTVPVIYTNDIFVAKEWIEEHICNRPVIVGWDTESSPDLPWRKSKYVGPATIQIATIDSAMVLEIANEIHGPNPNSLLAIKDILNDSSIIKAGVGVDDDMLDIYRWDKETTTQRNKNNNQNQPTKPYIIEEIFGRLDIGGIGSSKGRSASLKSLAKVILGLDLPKTRKLAMSNWANAPLSTAQIQYAARDAWVSAAIMDELYRLDPSTFEISSLLDRMQQQWRTQQQQNDDSDNNDINDQEQRMEFMDRRSLQRKKVKTKLFSILRKNDQKIPRSELSEDKLLQVDALEKEMKELAPPQRIEFDISHLGLSIWKD